MNILRRIGLIAHHQQVERKNHINEGASSALPNGKGFPLLSSNNRRNIGVPPLSSKTTRMNASIGSSHRPPVLSSSQPEVAQPVNSQKNQDDLLQQYQKIKQLREDAENQLRPLEQRHTELTKKAYIAIKNDRSEASFIDKLKRKNPHLYEQYRNSAGHVAQQKKFVQNYKNLEQGLAKNLNALRSVPQESPLERIEKGIARLTDQYNRVLEAKQQLKEIMAKPPQAGDPNHQRSKELLQQLDQKKRQLQINIQKQILDKFKEQKATKLT